uniref:Si:ch73-380n15.2 n=1 Tax=Tetraodon nigroviridis TaxID=99883 RepID=H3CK60_TETNG
CSHAGVCLVERCLLLAGSLQGQYQRKLYKELLANYNRLERPVVNDSAPILVELGLTLLQIIDVEENGTIADQQLWVMNYSNTGLNLCEGSGCCNKVLLLNRASFFKDQFRLCPPSADERFDATFHTNVLVNASGHCQYIPPGILKSTCYIDVRWFPFDVQKCNLKFGSWTHNGWLLDLQMLDVDTSTYIPNGEWDLVGVPAKRNELYYECCKEPYPDVTFTVTMRRRTLYYGLNLLIPCVLISGLALLVFLLPADSGEKISLGITVLLSLTVFMLLVAEIMPATSDSVPLIAQYFASTMMIVGMSVVVTVIVLQFHHHDPHGGKMPKWVRMVLLNWCAWFLRMKQPGDGRKRPGYKAHHCSQHHSSSSSIETSGPSGTSNGSMSFYFGNYHPIDSSSCPPSSDSGVALGGRNHSEEADQPVGSSTGGLGMGVGRVSIPPPEIMCILQEVSYIAQRFRDQDEAEAICSEWKFAAAVVDRLCLVAFSLFSIICTFTILMSAPNFIEAVSKDFT